MMVPAVVVRERGRVGSSFLRSFLSRSSSSSHDAAFDVLMCAHEDDDVCSVFVFVFFQKNNAQFLSNGL